MICALLPLAAVVLALCSGGTLSPGAGLSVSSIQPSQNALDAATVSPVVVLFDQPLDLSTLGASSIQVFGRWSGVMSVSYELAGDGRLLTMRPARPFLPGELVTVSIGSAVMSSSGEGLTGGFASAFWVAPAKGSGLFALEDVVSTRLEGEQQIQSYGLYAGDLNSDGAPDFSVPNELANDVRVLLNDGCGRYNELVLHPLGSPSSPSSNEGQDFDGDGFIDLAVANIEGDSMSVLLGDGAGGYLTPQTQAAGDTPRGLVTFDVEGDGDMDVITANRLSSDLCLFRNNGSGSFVAAPVIFEGGGDGETALASADADNDGYVDLFVAHHDSANATVLLNNGAGMFSISATEIVGSGPWMATAGDLNGDGNIDFATADAWSNTASVVLGDGAGGLAAGNVMPTGYWPIAVDCGDLDGDGDLELVTSSISSGFWRVFWNDGTGVFEAFVDLPAGTVASCATLVDDDRDGLLDLIGIDEFADEISLWRQVNIQQVGVQTASCSATLRMDGFALSAGFGGKPTHAVKSEGTLHIGLSGESAASYGVLIGPPLYPGLRLSAGTFQLGEPFALVTTGALDLYGETNLPILLPAGLAPGLSVCVQAFVGGQGSWKLSNPEVIEVAP